MIQMKEVTKTSFVFLRHGEPVGGKIFRGSTDDPLTEKGWTQMRKATKGLLFDEIVSSPLKRCVEFSTELQKKTQCNLNVKNEIQELHLGDWEGLSAAQVEKLNATALEAFWKEPYNNTPPNGESFSDFETRVVDAWQALCKQYISTSQSKTVLVVCHAGVMMVLLKLWLKLPIENILCIKLNYASKVRVEVFEQRYKLKPQIYIDHGYTF